ncbi:hypothetical protein [Paracoccus sp. SSK6]|uniref:hypothetical protein n=1 Tax=Paracoccus sp. SSK6 TaxID=3143131 RepID=UPI00321B5849
MNSEATEVVRFGSDDFDPSAYAEVAQNARLNDIFMSKSSYDVKLPDIFPAIVDEDGTRQSFLGKPKNCNFDYETGTLIGAYQWHAQIKSGRTTLLNLKVEYVLLYSGLKDAEEQYARLYFEKLARFTSYPYFRAFFSSTSSASGLALPPLPSLIDRVD